MGADFGDLIITGSGPSIYELVFGPVRLAGDDDADLAEIRFSRGNHTKLTAMARVYPRSADGMRVKMARHREIVSQAVNRIRARRVERRVGGVSDKIDTGWNGYPPTEYALLPFHIVRHRDGPPVAAMLVRRSPFRDRYGPWWVMSDGSGLNPATAGLAGWSYVGPYTDTPA